MQYEALYQELQNSTKMIRALLASITQEEAQIRPDRESWSILEVFSHLYEAERQDFGEHLDLLLRRPDEEWHTIDPQSWVTERRSNEQDFAESKGSHNRMGLYMQANGRPQGIFLKSVLTAKV